jgi:nucleoside-diphosphate-sugar epimerase
LRIFLSGSASHLAQALLPKLCAQPEISAVLGIDLQTAAFSHAKFTQHIADIRSPETARLMQGCEALAHLAFVVLRGKMAAATMADINVNGTQNLFNAAHQAGIARLVHLSSAAVYGGGENLQESAALCPLPGFLYGQHKVQVESWMADEFPAAVRLRPHIIFGPHCQPLLLKILRQPCYVTLAEPQPQLQCVHEDDVADAIIASLLRPASGPINLAAPGTYSLKQAIVQGHASAVPIPFGAAKFALHMAWRRSGFGGEPAWLEGVKQTLTLDCSRAQQVLGWQPQYDAAATLASVIKPRLL